MQILIMYTAKLLVGHLIKVGGPARRGKNTIVKRKMKERRVMVKKTMILQLQRNQGLFGQSNYTENLLPPLTI
jgi:retron-type reverse transcriptase